MILSGPSIRKLGIITPHVGRTRHANGLTYGESFAGYDICCSKQQYIKNGFYLLSSQEYFEIPDDVLGVVHDKSTWARQGVCVQNTVIEPGWKGHLTLEVKDHLHDWHIPTPRISFDEGCPIAQIVFHSIDQRTFGYDGKYQDQPNEPVAAILEKDEDK